MNDEYIDSLTSAYYYDKSIPCPTIIEAISRLDYSSNMSFNKAKEFLLKNFDAYRINTFKEAKSKCELSRNVVSFIIPLDFYIPLYEPYNACNVCTATGEQSIICGTVFSIISAINNSSLRSSIIICSVCSRDSDEFLNNRNSESEDMLMDAIIYYCNRIIASYESIPGRHSHYMHKISKFSLPSELQFFSFDRTARHEIDNGSIIVHDNVVSDLLYSELPLSKEELEAFRDVHINSGTVFMNTVDLITRIKDAINQQCSGNDEESIVLSDTFVDLCSGYLYCELRKCIYDEEKQYIIQHYSEISKNHRIWIKELSETMGFSDIKSFKAAIDFDGYYNNCRLIRNNIVHSFLLKEINSELSYNALIYACNTLIKMCDIAYKMLPTGYEKTSVGLLIDSLEFPLRSVRFEGGILRVNSS